MSWTEDLLAVYERNSSIAGIMQYKRYKRGDEEIKNPYVLLPPFHTTVTAQIEVVIDADGNFLSASRVEDDDKMTIIPVTEKSGSRTAGKAPHPLCDNLQYLTGYGAEECYEMYMQELERWHLSAYTHPKVDAVYRYLSKKSLLDDLIAYGVLIVDGSGKLDETVKIQAASQEKAFVRFIVRQKLSDGILEETCWKDQTLQNAFIEYYRSTQVDRELDYLTGKMESPSYLHSKKIRNEGDGAKLISSNDKENFTFRGRFATKEEAFVIGNETSQKIHSALKWLIRKQGRSFDTLTMVSWESGGANMPAWDADTEMISTGITASEEPEEENDWGDGSLEEMDKSESSGAADENQTTAEQFYQALDGYRKQVEFTSEMILMAFDAATSGRVSMVEYKKLDAARYLQNIQNWHDRGGWIQEKWKKGNRIRYYGIPGVKEIANILYGTESKKALNISDKNGKKMYAGLSRRLLPCIWDGRNLPDDLVRLAVNRASSPQSYQERYNWKQTLALACSFVKKRRYEVYKEEWDVALDVNCKDRNYLYGRLLAVADRIESSTYDWDKDAGRVTNAKRYMSTFSRRPFDTWKVIEESIQPYLSKAKINERRRYEKLIDGICQLFDVDSFSANDPLDGRYLLGFHSQSYELKHYKNNEEKTREEE